jgi:aspartyl-tRNA(Asn)/glutamyl-tRNA(Gln) amidotransferase subunit A
VGLKPSYGLLSRHGVVSYASSFDTVGVLANSVDCAASALDALAQRNVEFSRDSTFSCYDDNNAGEDLADSLSELSIAQSMAVSEESGEEEEEESLPRSLHGIRVGIPAAFSVKECPPEIRESWSRAAERLQRHGAEIVQISTTDISPSLVQTALSAYYVLVSAEASSNLSRYDGFRFGVAATLDEDSEDGMEDMTPLEKQYSATRKQGFGTEVKKRILCGASVLSSDKFHTHYEAAAKLRAALAQEMSSVLDTRADVLLIPTVLSVPPEISNGKEGQKSDRGDMNKNNTAMFANDVMTVPASLAGLPAISVPVPIKGEGMFVGGMQLISSRLKESILLKSARALQ